MRSTRASAAWAGIALATSFLSVTIVTVQPHTAATLAESVALPSYQSSTEVAKRATVTDIDATNISSERFDATNRVTR